MDVLESLQGFENVSVEQMLPYLAGAVALLFGIILGRLGVRAARKRVSHLEERIEQLKSRATDRGRMKNAAREEVANLALSLAPVVHDLNRDDLSRQDAPKLVMRMARGLFDPKQILLYAVSTVRGPYGLERRLQLVTYQGLTDVPDELKSIPMGEGKIGWVAQHELERTRDDWTKATANGESAVPDNHRTLMPDLIGPLVHYSKDGQQLLGVLCIGMPGKRPPEPKLTMRMVTDFGSLALVMASHLSQLRNQAHHDGLTKLYNKRRFLGELGPEMLIDCDQKGQQFSIFIFDIDNFKHYNDRNGHPDGDKLLKGMGELIRDSLKPGFVACRYGGEEFVIAMPNTDTDAAYEFAESLRIRIAETEFEHREAQPLGCISISGGIATSPRDAGSVEELLKLADAALYEGKKGGRNAVNRHRSQQIGDADSGQAAVELGEVSPVVDPAATDPSLISLDQR